MLSCSAGPLAVDVYNAYNTETAARIKCGFSLSDSGSAVSGTSQRQHK